jgi:hydrogenase maturation protease
VPGAQPIVIGLGNRMRGDDGAGLEVARIVAERAPEVRAVEHEREPTDLLAIWEGSGAVVVIDAVLGDEPGRVHRAEVGPEALKERPSMSASTHAVSLSEVIELGRSLNRLPDRLIVLGIEGDRFEVGAGLSSPVREAAETAADLALAELGLIP